MAIPYNNALDSYTPAFPGAPYTPRDFRNEQWPGYPVEDEPFTVPADADADGKYRLMLDLVPFDQLDFQLTVAGSLRVPVPYGEAVPPGRVGVSLLNGVIEFNEADAGESGLCSYTGRASALDAGALNQIGAELKAVQEAAGGLGDLAGFDGSAIGTSLIPATTGTYDLGDWAASKLWKTLAVDNIVAGEIGASGTLTTNDATELWQNSFPILLFGKDATLAYGSTGLPGRILWDSSLGSGYGGLEFRSSSSVNSKLSLLARDFEATHKVSAAILETSGDSQLGANASVTNAIRGSVTLMDADGTNPFIIVDIPIWRHATRRLHVEADLHLQSAPGAGSSPLSIAWDDGGSVWVITPANGEMDLNVGDDLRVGVTRATFSGSIKSAEAEVGDDSDAAGKVSVYAPEFDPPAGTQDIDDWAMAFPGPSDDGKLYRFIGSDGDADLNISRSGLSVGWKIYVKHVGNGGGLFVMFDMVDWPPSAVVSDDPALDGKVSLLFMEETPIYKIEYVDSSGDGTFRISRVAQDGELNVKGTVHAQAVAVEGGVRAGYVAADGGGAFGGPVACGGLTASGPITMTGSGFNGDFSAGRYIYDGDGNVRNGARDQFVSTTGGTSNVGSVSQCGRLFVHNPGSNLVRQVNLTTAMTQGGFRQTFVNSGVGELRISLPSGHTFLSEHVGVNSFQHVSSEPINGFGYLDVERIGTSSLWLVHRTVGFEEYIP